MNKRIPIILLIACWFFYCGDSGSEVSRENPALKKKQVENAGAQQKLRRDDFKTGSKLVKREVIISQVKFTSDAVADSDLEVKAVWGKQDPLVELQYQWFVNDKEVAGAEDPVLSSVNFQCNDWVVCFVKAFKDGRSLQVVKSKYIKILSLPPRLAPGPVTVPDVPGVFSYKIMASDPNQARINKDGFPEERKLEYELVAPRGEGIILNPATGEISWEITKEIVEKYAGKITLKFKVKNKEGAFVIGSLLLNFTQQEEK